jgi:mRNA interferase MazF
MPNTTTYDFGDIVLVPFPFTDPMATKKRPAVIVSSVKYNKARPDVILMAITSHLAGYLRIGEVVVADWKAAGLLKPSTIKPIITTIEKKLVIRTLGRLSQTDLSSLRVILKTIVGCCLATRCLMIRKKLILVHQARQ